MHVEFTPIHSKLFNNHHNKMEINHIQRRSHAIIIATIVYCMFIHQLNAGYAPTENMLNERKINRTC